MNHQGFDTTDDRRTDLDAEVAAHDAALAARGLSLWVGSEPTFTDRGQTTPEWLHAALGEDKLVRSREVVRAFMARGPGGLLLRPQGRSYPGEESPRWCFGLLRWRDGVPLWSGPPDPIVLGEPDPPELPTIELPDFGEDVASFLAALQQALELARRSGWTRLAFTGALPPCDARLALTTVTPDPAVVEVNAAPSVDALDFLQRSRRIYAGAAAAGLSPYRLHYNGVVADSGGGGQITLGGPSPDESPFVREPQLLPRLLRYFNHHPCLSYLFCHDFVGAGGQSVRSDERGSDAFDELCLALALLQHQPEASAEQVWSALAPFLSDAAGNNHRAEINVEKLRNPIGSARGRLGLVEFRALRMQHTPERATAIACLLRAIVAMLIGQPLDGPLVDWGRELHDRFALPFHLEQDLEQVLAELEAAGLGLGPALLAQLRCDEFRLLARIDCPGVTLELRRALEFWPLLGDSASPEQGGSSRLIDASTSRIELRLRAHSDDTQAGVAGGWQLCVAGRPLPLHGVADAQGPLQIAGLRWRAFVPTIGLHPGLPAQSPLQLTLARADRSEVISLNLHEWRPDGEAYPGLPDDLDEAARRRQARLTCLTGSADNLPPCGAETAAVEPRCWTLDLRWPTGP